jgi:hypothetical protein
MHSMYRQRKGTVNASGEKNIHKRPQQIWGCRCLKVPESQCEDSDVVDEIPFISNPLRLIRLQMKVLHLSTHNYK